MATFEELQQQYAVTTPQTSQIQQDLFGVDLSLAGSKANRLQQRVAEKQQRIDPSQLDNLGTYARREFNDGDTTGFAEKGKDQIRLARPGDSLGGQWVDTPESPWTATNRGIYNPATGRKEKRPLTQEELAAYNASKMALDNFAMGTTPASKESFDELRNNPLTPKNQALYDKAIEDMKHDGSFDNLQAIGIKGAMDKSGKRQLGDFVNTSYDPNETLSSRLIQTGNAAVHGAATQQGEVTTAADIAAITGEGSTDGAGGFFDSLARAPQALIAGGLKSAYDVADTGVELVGRVAGDVVGQFDKDLGNKIDKNMDLGTGDEKTAQINAAIHYNDKFNAEAQKKSGEYYDESMKDVSFFHPSTYGNIKWDKLGDAFKEAFKSPEAAAYSLGYIGIALAGVAEKGMIKLFGGALKNHAATVAKVASSNVSNKMKKKAIQAAEKKLSGSDRVKLFLAKNADAGLYGTTMNNDQMDDWVKANGGEKASYLRIGTGAVLNTVGMKLDMETTKFAIKDSKDLTKVLIDKFKGVEPGVAKKAMAKAAEYGARLSAAGVTEMPQEFVQSFIEAFNSVYGTDDRSALDVAKDEKVRTQAAKGAIMGAAGGVHMAGGSQVVSDTLGGATDLVAGSPAMQKAKEAAQATKDAAKAAKDSVTGGVNYTKEVLKGDSSLDKGEVQQAVNTILDTEAYDDSAPIDSTTAKPTPPTNKNAYGAAAKVIHEDNLVSQSDTIDDVERYGEEKAKEIYTKADEFDKVYSEAIDDATVGIGHVIAAEKAGEAVPIEDIHAAFRGGIEGMLAMRDDIASITGEDSNKVKLIDNKIATLIPLTTASTTSEMATVLKSKVDTKTKVAAVLGSSAASLEQVEEVLGSKDLTDGDKQLLEAKVDVLKNFNDVQKEKLIGGGPRLGALQWASLLASGKANKLAIKKLNAFVQGQQVKTNKLNKAIAEWDKANSMPWTKEGNKQEYKHTSTKAEDTKVSLRARAIKKGADTTAVVEIGDKEYDNIMTIADLAEVVNSEQVELDKLSKLAKDYSSLSESKSEPTGAKQTPDVQEVKKDVKEPVEAPTSKTKPEVKQVTKAKDTSSNSTSSEAPSKPVKPQTEVTGTTSPKEDTKAPVEAKQTPTKKQQVSEEVKGKEGTLPEINKDLEAIIPSQELEDERIALEMLQAKEYEGTTDPTETNKAVNTEHTEKLAAAEAASAKGKKEFLKNNPAFTTLLDDDACATT